MASKTPTQWPEPGDTQAMLDWQDKIDSEAYIMAMENDGNIYQLEYWTKVSQAELEKQAGPWPY